MTVDEMIDFRWQARLTKQFAESDRLRQVLDEHLVFTFDHKDYQEVLYLTEGYFKKMNSTYETVENPKLLILNPIPRKQIIFKTKRQYVEYRIKQSKKYEALFNAWLYSTNESSRVAKLND